MKMGRVLFRRCEVCGEEFPSRNGATDCGCDVPTRLELLGVAIVPAAFIVAMILL
jgi:hypothetical protein